MVIVKNYFSTKISKLTTLYLYFFKFNDGYVQGVVFHDVQLQLQS